MFRNYGNWLKSTAKGLFEYTPMGVAKSNTDKTIAAQKELAEYSYSKDLEMWERANAYNSPEAQMARLKEAGLNPNLVYGSGQVAGNTAGQLPRYQAPNVQYNYKAPMDLGRLLGLYQDVQMKGAQIANIQADTQRKETENRFGIGQSRAALVAEQYGLAATAGRRELDLLTGRPSFKGGITDYSLEKMRQDIKESQSRQEIQAQDKLFKQFQNQWMKAGITTSDHPVLRMLIRGWNASGQPGYDELMRWLPAFK